ncbi:type II toxin-antitoxin system VapC family toxin [Actinokineospora xionganensis]|uniref:Ribonuclease VapC n=1 Tax=Actinokineospora xionganensis TaxID=2684470 RepID=A0ABR7L5U3_9PSEU|nr:type II toxin-antitoxin system VapC family toxin [Actinokineospora xionganensis]MBC6447756.1 type II toxin-antitoxin system VapC family toxin [Actinokineospora xionganensis]
MSEFLLDTNIVSEIGKKTPNSGVAAWFDAAPASDLFLSVLVIGEIGQGIERLVRRDRAQATVFEQWLTQLVTVHAERIVPVTAEVADQWGHLNAHRLPVVDGLLVATAMVHGWTLVTRNGVDVASTGVRLLDPFTPS